MTVLAAVVQNLHARHKYKYMYKYKYKYKYKYSGSAMWYDCTCIKYCGQWQILWIGPGSAFSEMIYLFIIFENTTNYIEAWMSEENTIE